MAAEIGNRIAKSAAWMVGSRWAIRLIGLVSTIFLARLLKPQDFGLVALSMVVVSAMDVAGNFSFDLALIREGKATPKHYDTVWTLSILRGAFTGAGLALLATPAASFFGDPRVQVIVYCFAFAMLLEGFQNVGIVDFRKGLEFHREFAIQVIAKLLTFGITLTLAFIRRDYWALVAGIVMGKIANLVLSYTMHSYRPRLDLSEWHSLIGFSKWILGTNISNFLSSRLDTLVIGRIAGPSALGLYEVSNEIASLPTAELIWPIQRALFPGYALLMEDLPKFAQSYRRGFSIIMLLALPIAVGIASTAHLIIPLFLGPQWITALPLLQILAIAGILRVGQACSFTVLSLCRVKLLAYISTLNLLLFAALVVPGTISWGTTGAAYAVVATSAAMLVTTITITHRILFIKFSQLVSDNWRPIVAVVFMAFCLNLLDGLLPASETQWFIITQLFAFVVVGAIAYIGAILGLWAIQGSPDGSEKDVLKILAPVLRRFLAATGLISPVELK